MGLVKAKVVGSVGQLKNMLTKGANAGALTRIADKQELKVRFLEEPDTWVQYPEHYVQGQGFFPCSEGGTCSGCADGIRASKRFLVNAVDLEEKKVIALVLPYSLAAELAKKYDRFNTLLDRQYDLSRQGAGKNDTTYSVDYHEPRRFDPSRYDLFDLLEVLETQLPTDNENFVDDDEDADDRPAPKSRRAVEDDEDFAEPARPAKKAAPAAAPAAKKPLLKRTAPAAEPEPEDDEPPARPLRRPAGAPPAAAKKPLLRKAAR